MTSDQQKTVNIGIIGDYDVNKPSHIAMVNAIKHTEDYLSVKVKADWLPTPSFLNKKRPGLGKYTGIWASSGSPYLSMEGAITGIKLARESGKPFIST